MGTFTCAPGRQCDGKHIAPLRQTSRFIHSECLLMVKVFLPQLKKCQRPWVRRTMLSAAVKKMVLIALATVPTLLCLVTQIAVIMRESVGRVVVKPKDTKLS